ncbi:MAG TPA: methyltransferase, partial [Alphaproteobacteria bacterium]|nr:methyltransferase [Alphaproteobacteria bacterium]
MLLPALRLPDAASARGHGGRARRRLRRRPARAAGPAHPRGLDGAVALDQGRAAPARRRSRLARPVSAAAPLAFGRPLALQHPPLCPEIALALLDGEVDLEAACRDLDSCQPPPYWAFCWGAGQALARFVLDRPETVRGLHIVDFGAGCGVVSIAAARAGAASVTAVDADPAALAATRRNATHNGVEIALAARMPDACDVVLAADVLYEPGNLERLAAARAAGSTVVLADPERAASPALPAPPIARYEVLTLPDVDSPSRHAVVVCLAGGRGSGRRGPSPRAQRPFAAGTCIPCPDGLRRSYSNPLAQLGAA